MYQVIESGRCDVNLYEHRFRAMYEFDASRKAHVMVDEGIGIRVTKVMIFMNDCNSHKMILHYNRGYVNERLQLRYILTSQARHCYPLRNGYNKHKKSQTPERKVMSPLLASGAKWYAKHHGTIKKIPDFENKSNKTKLKVNFAKINMLHHESWQRNNKRTDDRSESRY